MLLSKKIPETVDYLKNKKDIVSLFIKHLGNATVMDLLLKIISAQDPLAENPTQTLDVRRERIDTRKTHTTPLIHFSRFFLVVVYYRVDSVVDFQDGLESRRLRRGRSLSPPPRHLVVLAYIGLLLSLFLKAVLEEESLLRERSYNMSDLKEPMI
jgi:hypothetical protein